MKRYFIIPFVSFLLWNCSEAINQGAEWNNEEDPLISLLSSSSLEASSTSQLSSSGETTSSSSHASSSSTAVSSSASSSSTAVSSSTTVVSSSSSETISSSSSTLSLPLAEDDNISGFEDSSLVIPASVLIDNDSGSSLTMTKVWNAQNGSVQLDQGTITFSPSQHFNGIASFQYELSNAQGLLDTALVQIDLAAVNDAPIFSLAETSIQGDEDAVFVAMTSIAIGITTGGGSDEINQSLTFTVTPERPELFEGTPTLTATGMLNLRFKENASGNSNLTVILCDNGGSSNGGKNCSESQNISVIIDAINDAPIARTDTIQIPINHAVAISDSQLLANDTDVEGHKLSIANISNYPTTGTIEHDPTYEKFYFTPDLNNNAEMVVKITIQDELGAEATSEIVIQVKWNDTVCTQYFGYKCGTVTDGRDYKNYRTIDYVNAPAGYAAKWMVENLRMRDPSYIDTALSKCPTYSGYAGSGNCEKYGVLYNGALSMDKVCPTNWHVATDQDWMQLEQYILGMDVSAVSMNGLRGTSEQEIKLQSNVGYALVENNSLLFMNNRNKSGFGAMGTGLVESGVVIDISNGYSSFWTGTEATDPAQNWYRWLGKPYASVSAGIERGIKQKDKAYMSVRCVADPGF